MKLFNAPPLQDLHAAQTLPQTLLPRRSAARPPSEALLTLPEAPRA